VGTADQHRGGDPSHQRRSPGQGRIFKAQIEPWVRQMRGAGLETTVAPALAGSVEMIVAPVAILKAGATPQQGLDKGSARPLAPRFSAPSGSSCRADTNAVADGVRST
jgi:hypothetical protein